MLAQSMRRPRAATKRPDLAVCPYCGRTFVVTPVGVCPHCGYPLIAILEQTSVLGSPHTQQRRLPPASGPPETASLPHHDRSHHPVHPLRGLNVRKDVAV